MDFQIKEAPEIIKRKMSENHIEMNYNQTRDTHRQRKNFESNKRKATYHVQ